MPFDQTNSTPTPAIEVDETTALLIRARGFVERGWCRWVFAKDAGGNPVDPTDNRAIEWCANGALIAAFGTFFGPIPAVKRLAATVDGNGSYDIAVFNNRQETVEPILAAFDRAIAAGG